jgi:hypothetical protein
MIGADRQRMPWQPPMLPVDMPAGLLQNHSTIPATVMLAERARIWELAE